MKSFATYLLTASAWTLATVLAFAQDVVPAVSLGDPIPSYQADPNVVPVSGLGSIFSSHGSSCNGCKLDFQPCNNPNGCKDIIVSVPCPGGDCGKAPSCATCAKPAPCKACDIVKHVHRPIAQPCTTCTAPKAAPACSACTTPARVPAACNQCETKKFFHHTPAIAACTTGCSAPKAAPACDACSAKTSIFHHHKPAACNTCTAPAAKPCDTGCKAAPACDACAAGDPCKAHATKHAHSRPIIDALTNLFKGNGHSHHAAPAAAPCSTCAAATTTMIPATTAQTIPTYSAPMTPQPTAYQMPAQQHAMPVPAALAPYAAPVPFSTALPPAETNPQR